MDASAHRDDETARLSTELEWAALRAVRRAYSDANATLFDGRLMRVSFQLTDGAQRLGTWVRDGRRIELSRRLVFDHGWATVVEVLRHEMAHQYVDEVLGCQDEAAHGATFQQVCAERGIDGGATGIPRGSSGPTPVLDRIAKLLSLAQSPNEHEAHAAMAAAQRLMLKHNLQVITDGTEGRYAYRHLGAPTGRVREADRVLATILMKHFFVDVIWVPVWRAREGKRGTVLEVLGNLENLDMAEYVHTFLTRTADRLWREHKRREKLKSSKDRMAYLAGVMTGFRDKLDAQAKKDASEGLVWVGDPALGAFFKKRHPRIRWTRHASSKGSAAHQQGQQAGRNIVLHRGMEAGASGGGPKLLRG